MHMCVFCVREIYCCINLDSVPSVGFWGHVFMGTFVLYNEIKKILKHFHIYSGLREHNVVYGYAYVGLGNQGNKQHQKQNDQYSRLCVKRS